MLQTLFGGAAGTYLGYRVFSDASPAEKFAEENAAKGIGVKKISTTRLAVIGVLALGGLWLAIKVIK